MIRLAHVLLMLALLVPGLSMLPGVAQAHTRSESHSSWTLDGRIVHMNFSVAHDETRRLSPDGSIPSGRTFLAWLSPHVGVTAAERPCTLTAPPRMIAAAPGFMRAEFQYICPDSAKMRLMSSAFFDLVPTHIHFAQIQKPDGDFVEQLITNTDRGIDLDEAGGRNLDNAGLGQFIAMGIMHILTGADHMSFLVGLVLISRRLRDLLFVVTGFTIGHSLTLALAVTGIIRPHAEFIDALVAMTIALIGAENVAVGSRRPGTVALWTGGLLMAMAALRLAGIGRLPPLLLIGTAIFAPCYLLLSGHLRDAGRVRLIVTLVFGLIHGFGFASDLLENRLPPAKLAQILVGFNLGVELGQLTIVLLLTGGAALLVRWKTSLPPALVNDVCAAALVAVGMFWFAQRSFA
jgi:hypothetical protein